MFLVLSVSLFTTRVILNSLGVIDFGISNVVGGFVSMLAFLNTSMSNGIQRFYNYHMGLNNQNDLTKVYNTALQIQAIIAVVVIVFMETIGLWYMNTKMIIPADRFNTAIWIFQFSVLSLSVVIMQVPYNASIIAHEKMQFYAYTSIFDILAKLAIAYILLVVGTDKLFAYGLLTFVVTILVFLLNFVYAKSNFKELKFQIKFSRDYFKPMIFFSGWNIFGTFGYLLKGQGLNILLNAFFGPVVNAACGVSNMVVSAVQGFQANIVIAFRPQIVQSYAANDLYRVKNLFYSLSKISFIMLAMLSIPIMIELDYILHLWLGDSVPEYTYSFTFLLLINMIISSLNTPFSQVVHATGKMKNYQIGTSLVVWAILPVSWIFLKFGFAPNSVFVVSLIMTIINQLVCMYLLKKIFVYSKLEYMKHVLIPCSIFSVIVPCITILPTLFMESSFLRLLLVGVLEIIVSCLVSYLLVLNQQERQLVIGYVSKLIKIKK